MSGGLTAQQQIHSRKYDVKLVELIDISISASIILSFDLIGDETGKDGAQAFFMGKICWLLTNLQFQFDLGRVVVMDGNVSNNKHYNMSMTSPATGSLSVSVPGGDTQILLVVAAVPEYFKSHQTYGYQVNIKSTLTTTSTPETTTTAYTTESTEGFRHLKNTC